MSTLKKMGNKKFLARMWGKENTYSLLVEVWTDAATMETSEKLKIKLLYIRSSRNTLMHICKDLYGITKDGY